MSTPEVDPDEEVEAEDDEDENEDVDVDEDESDEKDDKQRFIGVIRINVFSSFICWGRQIKQAKAEQFFC